MSARLSNGGLASPAASPPSGPPAVVAGPQVHTSPAPATTAGPATTPSTRRASARLQAARVSRTVEPEMPATSSEQGAPRRSSRAVAAATSTLRRSSRAAAAVAKGRITSTLTAGRRNHNQNLYQVEALVDRRRVGRAVEYLVKWEGWPASQNTWEPRRNLAKCAAMIREFNAAAKATEK